MNSHFKSIVSTIYLDYVLIFITVCNVFHLDRHMAQVSLLGCLNEMLQMK